MCIGIVEFWFGIANGQIINFWQSYLPATSPYVLFPDDNFSKYQWILTKLGMCVDIVEIWFAIANGQISSMFDRVTCLRHVLIFVSRQ